MDKFRDYSAGDFLEDESFLRWLTNPTQEDNEFWNGFLNKHPYKKAEIKEATLIFSLFYSTEHKLAITEQYDLWKKVQEGLKAPKKSLYLKWLKYAAVLAFAFFSGSISYYVYQQTGSQKQFQLAEAIPGKGEAVIILSDGSRVPLDKKVSEISYSNNGEQLVVNNDTIKQKSGSQTESMNRVIVSYGKKSMIVLSDGTKVWLNAGSQLIYPAVFRNSTRQVTLIGEAFFDVTKNPQNPFVVHASDVSIQVLGTRFDVSAYPDDKIIQTVLEEGKVNLKYLGNGILDREHLIEMQPNQMVEFDKSSGEANSKMVNVAKYISWKDGMLEFDRVDLERALMQVERFYNVKIHLSEREIGNYKLSGKLDLKDEPEDVLNVIKLTVPIDWQKKSNGDFVIIKKCN